MTRTSTHTISTRSTRTLAVAAGVVCHTTFLAAIASMAIGLYSGMRSGFGPFRGSLAIVANALLVLQFPIVHSTLLGKSGRRALGRLFPAPLGGALVTTTFATVASAQILAVFVLWSPIGPVLFHPHRVVMWLHMLAFAGSWVFLMKAIADADIRVQTGYLGWSALLRGTPPSYRDFPTDGAFRLCRQPIYLGFALVLWTGPIWSADRIALAVAWTIYCAFGPLHKELRYLDRFGERYREYRARVPYILPTIER